MDPFFFTTNKAEIVQCVMNFLSVIVYEAVACRYFSFYP